MIESVLVAIIGQAGALGALMLAIWVAGKSRVSKWISSEISANAALQALQTAIEKLGDQFADLVRIIDRRGVEIEGLADRVDRVEQEFSTRQSTFEDRMNTRVDNLAQRNPR